MTHTYPTIRTGRLLWVLIIMLCASTLRADDQNWTTNKLTWKSSSRLVFSISSETKFRSWDYGDGLFLKNWVVGGKWKLNRHWSMGLFYKHERTRRQTGPDVMEHRPYLDMYWKAPVHHHTALDIRARTEFRRFDRQVHQDQYRFRFRFRLMTTETIAGIHTQPYLAFEPFYDSRSDTFAQYRAYAGTMIRIQRHAKLRIGTILDNARHRAPHHVLDLGITLIF